MTGGRRSTDMERRELLTATAALAALGAAGRVRAEGPWRVGVIGHTGRGNYGHDIDTVWLDLPATRIVAVADPDPAGREEARKRLGGPTGYADYKEMLAREKPDLVAVCPRWPDQHRDMVVACAGAGVKGVLIEKPLARNLEEADALVAAADSAGMRVAVAHQTRISPRVAVIRQLLEQGKIGDLLEVRARGKEDARGGGEDMMVLGDHLFDVMRLLLGDPEWCFARVTDGDKPVTRAEVRRGGEDLGPLAGSHISAMFGFPKGVTATFGSTRAQHGRGKRFGVSLYGTLGAISFGTGPLPAAWILEDPSWTLFDAKGQWKPITSAGIDQPEPLKDTGLRFGNKLIVADLLKAIEEKRRPVSSAHDGRDSLQMILAVYESHRLGKPVTLPLSNRRHPLELI